MLGDDRLAVLVLDLIDVPRTARGAAAEWVNAQLKLIARLQGLARPAIADQSARRAAFKIPKLAGAVLFLDVQNDEGVRAGITIFLHRARQLDRVLLIEHGKGMMRQHDTAGRNHRTADE